MIEMWQESGSTVTVVPDSAAPRIGYVYALVDPHTDEVRYVGIAFDPRNRLKIHVKEALSANATRTRKVNWLRSLGVDQPVLMILESIKELDTKRPLLNAAERKWIARYRAEGANLTNLTDGGDGLFGRVAPEEERARRRLMRHSEETKAKIAASHVGITHGAEARAKISAARRGKPLSLEHRTKVGRPGRTQAPEHVAKRVAKLRGRVVGAEARANIGAASRGRLVSPETRAKISAALQGRQFSDEHRAKLREANARRFADVRARKETE